ncbi:hypothetical protein F5B20DRAFT_596660 [Whalleya microplaca]|nr:hypothetical protein F5B20DRAFT_596660 [Whalleya microplaca]
MPSPEGSWSPLKSGEGYSPASPDGRFRPEREFSSIYCQGKPFVSELNHYCIGYVDGWRASPTPERQVASVAPSEAISRTPPSTLPRALSVQIYDYNHQLIPSSSELTSIIPPINLLERRRSRQALAADTNTYSSPPTLSSSPSSSSSSSPSSPSSSSSNINNNINEEITSNMAQKYHEDDSDSQYDGESDPHGTRKWLSSFKDRDERRKHFLALLHCMYPSDEEFNSWRHPFYGGIEEDGPYDDWYKAQMRKGGVDIDDPNYNDGKGLCLSKEVYEPKIGDEGIEDEVALGFMLKIRAARIEKMDQIRRAREAAHLDEYTDDSVEEDEEEEDEEEEDEEEEDEEEEDEEEEDEEEEDEGDRIRTTWVTAKKHTARHESSTPPTSASLDGDGITPGSSEKTTSLDPPSSGSPTDEDYLFLHAKRPVMFKLVGTSLKYLFSQAPDPAPQDPSASLDSAGLSSATLSAGTMVADEPSPVSPQTTPARRGRGRPRKSDAEKAGGKSPGKKSPGKGKGKRKRASIDDVEYRPEADSDADFGEDEVRDPKRPRRVTRLQRYSKVMGDDGAYDEEMAH